MRTFPHYTLGKTLGPFPLWEVESWDQCLVLAFSRRPERNGIIVFTCDTCFVAVAISLLEPELEKGGARTRFQSRDARPLEVILRRDRMGRSKTKASHIALVCKPLAVILTVADRCLTASR
jgi:hypothetical protein